MREIEIKVKVSDPQKLLDALSEQGIELGPPHTQHDVVYGPPGAQGAEQQANWLRIRTVSNGDIYFTLKRSVTGQLDSIEHEVKVDNADELRSIIENLGYELFSDLTKTRRVSHVGDDIEICFDEVDNLGFFIEAEKLVEHNGDRDKIVAELWTLFEELDLSKDDEVNEGYDILDRKARGIATES